VRSVARAAAWVLIGGTAWHASAQAQDTGEASPALALQPSTALQESLAKPTLKQVPSFAFGDQVSGQTDVNTVLEGHAELRRHDAVIRADRIEHTDADDTAHAIGNVRVLRRGDLFEGPEAKLKLDTDQGYFLQPQFKLLKTGGQGYAERADFIDQDHMTADQAVYSTCQRPPGAKWMPDWWLTASRVEFDNAEDEGIATNGVLLFKGIPVLAAPYISFPLSDQRKSGLLDPTIGLDNTSGFTYAQPYYFNLAPNRDATLTPTLMTKRGVELAGEYRYLEPTYNGVLQGSYLPGDKLRGDDRWSTSITHNQAFSDLPVVGGLGLQLNINRVSDNNYWRDFPGASPVITQRLLPTVAQLSWGRGDWSVTAGSYTFQTLQDPTAPIVAPYNRGAVVARYAPAPLSLGGIRGWDFNVVTDLSRYSTPNPWVIGNANTTTMLDGSRATVIGQLSKTWQAPGWFVKPMLQVNARQYQFDQTLSSGQKNPSYVLPTVSLDSGLFFERDTSIFGRKFVQTLEPRLFYTHTPYSDQSALPLFDTAAYDYNLATVFMSNPYAGNDRIADLNAATFGLTSRLLDPDTGAELLSLGIAQRNRFSDQRVTLPGEATEVAGATDLLLGARVNWTPQWSMHGTLQYSPKLNQSQQTTLGVRYNPGNYRVFNASYRFANPTLTNPTAARQTDFSWQWPLANLFGAALPDQGRGRGLGSDRWYTVGRLNYSIPDHQLVNMLAGFEYDGGCWIGRVVFERLQNSTTSANQRILFQLEFTGFTRIGASPVQSLRNNVPRYQLLREEVIQPSRFESYE